LQFSEFATCISDPSSARYITWRIRASDPQAD
jgi:hypothetical protein